MLSAVDWPRYCSARTGSMMDKENRGPTGLSVSIEVLSIVVRDSNSFFSDESISVTLHETSRLRTPSNHSSRRSTIQVMCVQRNLSPSGSLRSSTTTNELERPSDEIRSSRRNSFPRLNEREKHVCSSFVSSSSSSSLDEPDGLALALVLVVDEMGWMGTGVIRSVDFELVAVVALTIGEKCWFDACSLSLGMWVQI